MVCGNQGVRIRPAVTPNPQHGSGFVLITYRLSCKMNEQGQGRVGEEPFVNDAANKTAAEFGIDWLPAGAEHPSMAMSVEAISLLDRANRDTELRQVRSHELPNSTPEGSVCVRVPSAHVWSSRKVTSQQRRGAPPPPVALFHLLLLGAELPFAFCVRVARGGKCTECGTVIRAGRPRSLPSNA
jgi:hypothetical protein